MSTSVTEAILEKKFLSVSNTQDSIQTLSLWLLHHKAHHQKIVNTWLKVLKKDKINHRLTLFYLANDVIQNSKRKNVSFFKDSFAEVLKDATHLVRDEQIRKSVDRVFNIWEERSVYDSDFIATLQAILTNTKVPTTASSKLIAEFKCEKVVEKIRVVKKIEVESTTKSSTVNLTKLNATNAEIVQKLKDRKHGQHFSREFEENARCLEELVKVVSKEIEERENLIELLENSEIYYDTQRGEAKIVANAYKNFASRVKLLQKKLEELMGTLESPIPSPCSDAPSPTNSETELNLPGEDKLENDSDLEKSASSSVSSSSKPATSSVGNPIPTVSNLFTQETGNMTSWLDTFTKKSNAPVVSTTANTGTQKNSTSLDSRLSTLLQNIPSGFQNTLLGASLAENSESVTNSPSSNRNSGSNAIQHSEAQTSMKDEYSGQNTPLQDEDTPLGTTFFSRLAAAPKASQSPKEILQGLKDFIQSASSLSNEKAHAHESSWSSDKSESSKKADNSDKTKTVSHSSDVPLTFPSSIYESPMHPVSSTAATIVGTTALMQNSTDFSQVSFSDTLTYTPVQSSSETSISQSIHQNLSFIPTLVPSTPTGSNFNFDINDTYSAYSPDIQNYEADMDIESGDEDSQILSSAEQSDITDSKTGIGLPRQSALITLVTDNGTSSEERNQTSNSFSKSGIKDFPADNKKRPFSALDMDYPEPKRGPFPEAGEDLVSDNSKGIFHTTDRDQFHDVSTGHFPAMEMNVYPEPGRNSLPAPKKGSLRESDGSISDPDGADFSEPSRYLTTIDNTFGHSQSDWPIGSLKPDTVLPPAILPEVKESPLTGSDGQDSLNEAYFLSTPPPAVEPNYPNGERRVETPVANVPLLKIETVQSYRTSNDNNWNKPMWDNYEFNKQERYEDHRVLENPPAGYQDYQPKRQFDTRWPRFPPRNHWPQPQYRPPPALDHGPRQRWFPPPSSRGRGWNRHPRPQY